MKVGLLCFLLYMFTAQGSAQVLKENQVELQIAIFAGGCFWCEQAAFDQIEGVIETAAGYTGGLKINPTYEEVSQGETGHVEAVRIVFNPRKIGYEELLKIYWHNVDPTRNDGQFCDEGAQYRPIIFYIDENQKLLAERSKQALIKEAKVKPILVEILPAKTFYPAEEYHQEYHEKNPLRYKLYCYSCGRDQRLKEIWGNTNSGK